MKPKPLHPCSACPRYHPPIPGDGPTPCDVMVIGEAPARRELEGQARDRIGYGKVLVGDSGAEYTGQYLPLAGLTREQVYTTNIAKCADKSLDNPTPERASTCAEFHLHSELRVVRPKLIITLGAVALHTLFPGHSMDMEHGIPFEGTWGSWSGIVVPMYHPAAGLHQAGRFMTLMREDWEHLKVVLKSGMRHVVDPYQGREDYRECSTPEHVVAYMGGRDLRYLAVDTEVESMTTLKPFCLSFSHSPGTSRVIRAKSTDALRALNFYCQDRQIQLVFHNAGFDPPVLREMGITVHPDRFLDTMMMAYHLGRFQQSLKVLAYRLCGMTMKEFADVAGPHSKWFVTEWLLHAYNDMELGVCWEDYNGEGRLHTLNFPWVYDGIKKGEAGKLLKNDLLSAGDKLLVLRGSQITSNLPHGLTKRVVNFVNKLKNPRAKALARVSALLEAFDKDLENTDPWDRFANWSEDIQKTLVDIDGPMPELSIKHVPWPEALHYSARDADATIRILPLLRHCLRGVGRETL